MDESEINFGTTKKFLGTTLSFKLPWENVVIVSLHFKLLAHNKLLRERLKKRLKLLFFLPHFHRTRKKLKLVVGVRANLKGRFENFVSGVTTNSKCVISIIFILQAFITRIWQEMLNRKRKKKHEERFLENKSNL